MINKLKVIEQFENGVPGKRIAKEFGIGQQAVSDIKKQKKSVKTFALKFNVDSDKSSVDVKKAKRSVTRRSCIVVDSQQ
jgi:predicted DNA-binding protein YlxM (UPF0122 family)